MGDDLHDVRLAVARLAHLVQLGSGHFAHVGHERAGELDGDRRFRVLARAGAVGFDLGAVQTCLAADRCRRRQAVLASVLLIYAALLSIPDAVIEAAEMDGVTGITQFCKITLPLILPSIGIISILTFVGNFNAFDLIYSAQGALAGPNYATDILGTFLYRTFFGFQLQLGDRSMGATIASMMFFIILAGVCLYLFFIQTRMRRYQF